MPTMSLDVPMENDEVIETGDKMADVLAQLDAVKAEKKVAMQGFNRRIMALEGDLGELARMQREKTKKADVEVETRYEPEHREMTIVRLDTGAVVQRRPATVEERSPELPGMEPTAEAGKTEEQLAADTPEQAEDIRDARLAEEAALREADAAVGLSEPPATLLRVPEREPANDVEPQEGGEDGEELAF